MKIFHLLEKASRDLQAAGIETCEVDARLLFQFYSGMSRSSLIIHGGDEVDTDTAEGFEVLVRQRCQRVPLHYITGSREFWSLDFLVTPAVLVPRPETEFLLTRVVEIWGSGPPPSRALDMCTGSGVIAVVLARELGCRVTAVDISTDALSVANRNFKKLVSGDLMTPVCSNLFSALKTSYRYDLIVCNPPYIAEEDIPGLEPEVSRHEPLLALAGGSDGLSIIDEVIRQSWRFLGPGGYLFLEIGADQADAVCSMLGDYGNRYEAVAVHKDWAGRDRVVQARLVE